MVFPLNLSVANFYTARNTLMTEGQPSNRLPFFHADEQKGVTSHDKTARENPRGIDRRN